MEEFFFLLGEEYTINNNFPNRIFLPPPCDFFFNREEEKEIEK